jgi:ribokinase
VPTAFVASLGDDSTGDLLSSVLTSTGVDVRFVTRGERLASGVALVTIDEEGANTVVVSPQANSALDAKDVDRAGPAIATSSVVLAQLEVPLPSIERAMFLGREAGAVTILNPAPAGPAVAAGRERLSRLLSLVDVLVPNETEASDLTGAGLPEDAARLLLEMGASSVVVTLGQDGAIFTKDERVEAIAPFFVQATDTTGAGDAFCGVLASAIAQGRSMAESLRRASAAGALCSAVVGASAHIDAAAIDALIGDVRAGGSGTP